MASLRSITGTLLLLTLVTGGCAEESMVSPAPGELDTVSDVDETDGQPPSPDGDDAPEPETDVASETTTDVSEDLDADIAPPAGPTLIEAQVTWSGWTAEVRPTPATFALATDAGLWVQGSEGELVWVDPSGFEVMLEAQMEPIDAGVELGESGSLFASAEGLTGLVDGQLAPSPLNEHLTDSVQVMAYDDLIDRLWLSTGSTLMLHESGALYDIEPDGLSTGPAHLSFGGEVDGARALWVASGDSIYALSGSGDDLVVSAWVEGVSALALACDGDGRVWASADGDLYRRSTDGDWDWLRLPSPVGQVAAHPSSGALWIATSDGVWRHEADQFGPVEGAAKGTWLTVDPSGALVGSDPEASWRMGVGEEPLPPPPPTWSKDIKPISEASCILCHGPGALGAAQMYLAEQWEERIDDILTVVSSGAMPLPPNPVLDAATIGQIESWKAAGFPE